MKKMEVASSWFSALAILAVCLLALSLLDAADDRGRTAQSDGYAMIPQVRLSRSWFEPKRVPAEYHSEDEVDLWGDTQTGLPDTGDWHLIFDDMALTSR